MIKKFGFLFLFCFLSISASAFNITYYVADINTMNPIFNASVIVKNSSDEKVIDTYTDIYGYSYNSVSTSDSFITYITKNGYIPNSDNSVIIDDTYINFYLTPISSNGIVRMIYDDLTFNQHSICIFYQENNRLSGCYEPNSTIQFIINKGYRIVPRIYKSDIISSPESIDYYSPNYLMPIIGIFIIIGTVLMVIFILIYIFRGRKK